MIAFLYVYTQRETLHCRSTMFFRFLARAKIRMQNCKISRDLNPSIESETSYRTYSNKMQAN